MTVLRPQIPAAPVASRLKFGNVVGGTITRLVGAILLERNDEWAVQRSRYITLESIAPIGDDPSSACPPWQPDPPGPSR